MALAEMDAVSPGDLMKKITLDGKVGAGYTRGARLRTRWPQVTNQGPTKRVTLGGKVGCGMSFMHTHVNTHSFLTLPRHTMNSNQAVTSCKKAGWPAQLPGRGRLVFEFSVRKAARGLPVMEPRK